jgi:RHS repeat-associated protein
MQFSLNNRLFKAGILAVFLLISFSYKGLSQNNFTVSGPVCVTPGVPYTYTIAGNTGLDRYSWFLEPSEGYFQGSNEGTTVTIVWTATNCSAVQPPYICTKRLTVFGLLYISQTCYDNSGWAYDCSYYQEVASFILDVRPANKNFAGVISPETQVLNYLQMPSSITSHPNPALGTPLGDCNGLAIQWQISNNYDGIFTDIPGAISENYSFSLPLIQTTYFRRKITSAAISTPDYSNVVKVEIISPFTENRNYVREHTIVVKGVTTFAQADQLPIGKKFTSTTYLDGLGRPIQKIEKEISSTSAGTWNDMVVHIDYDAGGRTPQSFLPYSSSSTIGFFKTDAATAQPAYYMQQFNETHAYSRVEFDNSPLNRTVKNYAPGTNLGGNNVNVSVDYDFNNSNAVEENVRIWRIGYPAGSVPYSNTTDVYAALQLYKTISIDEYGKKTIEYKDFTGNIVLKKVQDKNEGPDLDQQHKGWACTYYVYDDFNRLRFIITPKAVEWLKDNNWNLQANTDLVNELCFWNEYDKKGRVIRKKSPGGAFIEMIYDERDRLVYTQDGKQRTQSKWITSLYDSQDRVVLTGIMTYPGQTRDGLQSMVDNISFSASSANFIVTTDNSQSHTLSVKGNPLASSSGLYVLTIDYYDHYNYPRVKTFNQSFTIDQTVPADETEDVAKSDLTLGTPTGSFVRVLDGTEKFLASTIFYDREGSVIQTHSETYRNTVDINTIQYDFAGRIRSSYTKHQSNLGEINIFNRNVFDKIGRVIKITESINGSGAKELVEYTFNELGQVLKKRLAPGFAGADGPQLETLNYEYNIRGNLTSINKNYVNSYLQSGNYFGMELAYETLGTNFSYGRIDGNISGISWKTRGDNIQRKYEYVYDARGQFSQAVFKQKNYSGAGWTDDKANFSTSVLYDINGNITNKIQHGIVPGMGVALIDFMTYTYDKNGWSNRLVRVDDNLVQGLNGKLGDFKDGTSNATGGGNDYTYNEDGQLTADLNKEIGVAGPGIEYNLIGTPSKVTFTNTTKTITYTYDAAGNKLRKRVYQPGPGATVIDITTDYVSDFIYENGNLAFFSHAEGRVRIITPVNNGVNYLNGGVALPGGKQGVYDYYIKDHLTSVRMILTEEQHQTNAMATMELPVAATEEAIFGQQGTNNEVAKTRQDKPPGWTSNTTEQVSRVSGIGTDNKVGPNVLMRVMAGDMLSAQTKYYYATNGTYPLGSVILNDVISSIIGSINGNKTTALIKENAGNIQSGLGITGGDLDNFIQRQGRGGGRGTQPPKAFMTVLFFDEQFNFIQENSSFVRVQTPGDGASAISFAAEAPKNGYAIVYLSNETNQYVYFDDFQVTHNRGRIIEENHYYAFGLKIAGISSKAMPSNLGGAKANSRVTYGYQGNYSEEDIDAIWNEFDLRTYDPQIGRWLSIDPYDEFTSGYIGMGNNPVNKVDPTGGFTDPSPLAKAFMTAMRHGGTLGLTSKGVVYASWFADNGEIVVSSFGKIFSKTVQATPDVISRLNGILSIYLSINFKVTPAQNFQQIDQAGYTIQNKSELIKNDFINAARESSWDVSRELSYDGERIFDRSHFIKNYWLGRSVYVGPATGQANLFYPEWYFIGSGGGALFKGLKAAKTSSNLWKVGSYSELRGLEVGLDAHHVGQKALMSKFVPGYSASTAPSILVPKLGHTVGSGVVSRSTAGFTNARQVLARDIFELRRVYGGQGIPNSSLQQLIQMNKTMYPGVFIK